MFAFFKDGADWFGCMVGLLQRYKVVNWLNCGFRGGIVCTIGHGFYGVGEDAIVIGDDNRQALLHYAGLA